MNHKLGIEYLSDLVRIHNSEYLLRLHGTKHPAIIIVAHIGPPVVVLSGFYRLGIPIMLLRKSINFKYPPEIETIELRNNTNKKAFALKRAIDYLKSGGFVLIALDGSLKEETGALKIEFLGRQFSFHTGIALMSRLTNAPVIPVSTSWPSRKGLFDMHIHTPIKKYRNLDDRNSFERYLIAESVRWLENEILKNPYLLRPSFFKKYFVTAKSSLIQK